jgi:hypothetical protein
VRHREENCRLPESLHQKGQGLKGGDLEGLSAANIGARQLVVTSYHVRLSFGEAGAVALVGPARKLVLFAADDPGDFVVGGLSAPGTSETMGSLLGGFVEKVPFFHLLSSASRPFSEVRRDRGRRPFRQGGIYSILNLGMAKRKQERFSATKAVKANARERVGQPKPTRVVRDQPRTGRKAKHKDKLEEMVRGEE